MHTRSIIVYKHYSVEYNHQQLFCQETDKLITCKTMPTVGGRRNTSRVVLLLLASLLFATTLVSSMAALPRDAVAALNGAEGFNDIDELTRYLDELKQYYTIVGRPR